jgi:hypothetical protein
MDDLGGAVGDRDFPGELEAAEARTFGRRTEQTSGTDAEQGRDEGLRSGEQTRLEDFATVQLRFTLMVAAV